jgi:methylated-DNA-protein-cysteine methyltransferase-like protein
MTRNRAQKHNTFSEIYTRVKEIPAGRVATYGQIAALVSMGLPARIVGYALNCLPEESDVPWQRVINRHGEISYSVSRNQHDSLQRRLLEQEGIVFNLQDKIDLDKYLWQP